MASYSLNQEKVQQTCLSVDEVINVLHNSVYLGSFELYDKELRGIWHEETGNSIRKSFFLDNLSKFAFLNYCLCMYLHVLKVWVYMLNHNKVKQICLGIEYTINSISNFVFVGLL